MTQQPNSQRAASERMGGGVVITGDATNSIIAGTLDAKSLIYGDTSKTDNEVVKWLYQRSKLQSESGIHSVYCEDLENLLRLSSTQPTRGALLLNKPIREWIEGTSSKLWLVGSSGVDKSTVSATLIHDLLDHGRSSQNSSACVYAFLGRRRKNLQTPENVMKNLLAQLVSQRSKVSIKLRSTHQDWQQRGQFTMETVVSLMKSEAESFKKIFLVLDVLDGCWSTDGNNATPWADLLANITRLSPRFNILIVSAEDRAIQSKFLDAKQVQVNKLSNAPLRKDQLYKLAISKIERQDISTRDLVIRALVWLTFAERSLTMTEMYYVLSTGGNDECRTPRDQLFQIIRGSLAQMCANLVVVEGETGETDRTRVRLVDPTARDILKPWLNTVRKSPESIIAKECLQCILHDNLRGRKSEEELNALINGAALLKYASSHWYQHVESFQAKEGEDCPLTRVEERIFDDTTASNIARAISGLEHEREVTGIHLASFWGIADMIDGLHKRAIEQAELGRGLYPEESRLVDKKTRRGGTPLHFAVAQDHCEVIERLINLRADVKASDSLGRTALHQAIVSGHNLPVLTLLKANLDVNATDKNGDTPLISAAKNGMIDAVKYLVNHRAKLDNEDRFGSTALRNATEGNHSDIVWYLLEKRAQWKSRDREWSLFYWATTQGQADILDFLIKQGEDVNITRPGMDGTPLMDTVRYDHWKASWLLVQSGARLELSDEKGDTALHVAIRYQRQSIMWLLLQSGANPNQPNKAGMTALHGLAMTPDSSSSQSVAWLLVMQFGAKVDVQNKNQQSPLHLAAKYGHASLASFLVTTGQASLKIRDSVGRTALHVAADNNSNDEVARILMAKADSSDLKLLDTRGESALHIAAARCNGALFLALCKPEIIDQEDGSGRTALQRAIDGYDSDSEEARWMVWCLIRRGADVNRKTGDRGRTLVHLAASKGLAEVVEMMFKLSTPDISVSDDNGLTPMSVASDGGHRNVVEILKRNVPSSRRQQEKET